MGLCFVFLLRTLVFASPLDEELQKLKQAGIPATIEELNLAEIPDNENGALVYREAFKLMDDLRQKYTKEWESMPSFLLAPDTWETVPEEMKAKVSNLVINDPAFNKVYQLLEKATDMECRFYPRKDYDGYVTVSGILTSKRLSDLAAFRNGERFLMSKAKIEAEKGKINQSLATIITGFKVSRASSLDVPVIISQLVRIAMNSIVLRTLEDTNEKGMGDTALYRILINEIEKERECPLIFSALRSEVYIYGIQMYDWQKKQAGIMNNYGKMTADDKKKMMGEMTKVYPNMPENEMRSLMENPEQLTENQEVLYLKMVRQNISITQHPYWQSSKEWENMEEELKKAPEIESGMPLMLLPGISRASLQEARNRGYLASAEIGLANCIYRQKHGEFVESLVQLTPEILPTLPLDPFTGKNYIYRKKDKGFIVYSVGDNLKDDGGVSQNEKKWKGDFDIVWEDSGTGIQ